MFLATTKTAVPTTLVSQTLLATMSKHAAKVPWDAVLIVFLFGGVMLASDYEPVSDALQQLFTFMTNMWGMVFQYPLQFVLLVVVVVVLLREREVAGGEVTDVRERDDDEREVEKREVQKSTDAPGGQRDRPQLWNTVESEDTGKAAAPAVAEKGLPTEKDVMHIVKEQQASTTPAGIDDEIQQMQPIEVMDTLMRSSVLTSAALTMYALYVYDKAIQNNMPGVEADEAISEMAKHLAAAAALLGIVQFGTYAQARKTMS